MNKMGSKLGGGAAALLVSGFGCKALGAVFRLPLTNLLGLEGIGIFQLVMSLFSFALVLTCGGVTSSLSKLISSARAREQSEKIVAYFKRALFWSVVIGFLVGLIFSLFGKQISELQGVGESKIYMLFLPLLPLAGVLATLRGFFQGYENMVPTAISQIVEQVFKFAFGLLFASIFLKYGTTFGVFGAFLGLVISELCAVILLAVTFVFKSKPRGEIHDMQTLKFVRREFDRANFTLMLSACVLPFVGALDSLFILSRLQIAGLSSEQATTLFGLQSGVVGAILNFPLVISLSVTTTLLPNISYAISRGSGGRTTIEKSLKTLFFLILPTTFGLIAICKPLLAMLYPNMDSAILNTAFELMLYGGFSIVFTALMQFFVMLLQAHGQFAFLLLSMTIGGLFKLAISFFLSAMPGVNIFALVLGNISLPAVVCVLALWKLRKISVFSLKLSDLFSLALATFAMFLVVYTFLQGQHYSPFVNLVLAVLMGVVVYIVLTTPFVLKLRTKKFKLT